MSKKAVASTASHATTPTKLQLTLKNFITDNNISGFADSEETAITSLTLAKTPDEIFIIPIVNRLFNLEKSLKWAFFLSSLFEEKFDLVIAMNTMKTLYSKSLVELNDLYVPEDEEEDE
jgi:hypothetical protein